MVISIYIYIWVIYGLHLGLRIDVYVYMEELYI